jgi:hypothetical protein
VSRPHRVSIASLFTAKSSVKSFLTSFATLPPTGTLRWHSTISSLSFPAPSIVVPQVWRTIRLSAPSRLTWILCAKSIGSPYAAVVGDPAVRPPAADPFRPPPCGPSTFSQSSLVISGLSFRADIRASFSSSVWDRNRVRNIENG